MRSRDATLLSLLQSEGLDATLLVAIALPSSTIRLALDTADRTWNGQTWTATAGGLGEMQESAEREVPSLQLVLQNLDGVIGPQIDPASGGEDLRRRRVTIYQCDRRRLSGAAAADLVVEWEFIASSVQWLGRDAVAIELGVFPAAEVMVPDRTLQGLRCRWRYRGLHCGSTSELPDCERTVAACRLRFPGEALRFGGFPTAADARALRVD